jgi:hypothetical protein
MDRELAGAVFSRWNEGLPISEAMLYKAASVMGVDPVDALMEARYYSCLDQYLLEKRAMTAAERIVFSAAAGFELGNMEKSASAHGFSPDELIFEALRARDFRPNLEKIANLSAVPGADPMMSEGQDPYEMLAAQSGDAMGAPPQPGAQVQQQPIARFKPSPTAPEQAMASPTGNMDQLIQEQQGLFQDPQMQGNGGQPPAAGMPQPAPPPPSPEERIQQVGPNLDPETVGRYSEQLVRFEEGLQMPINDPKQMVKFVKELQKVDGKKIDQGIKAMGQQLEQEQAQELGVDGTPTIDGPGGAGGAGGVPGQGVMAGAPGGASAPSPQEGPPVAQSPGGGEGSPPQEGAGPQQPPQKPPAKQPPQPGPQQAAPAAVEKVANAARALARATLL